MWVSASVQITKRKIAGTKRVDKFMGKEERYVRIKKYCKKI